MTTLCAAGIALSAAASTAQGDERAMVRVEARSATLLAVAIVNGDRMSVHLSRLLDNAPVSDASLTVVLRGTAHPATAEADGGYALQSKDLEVPGSAAVEFQVKRGGAREDLDAVLVVGEDQAKPQEKNNARQLWWWVLNFGVCIGFLMLISRRRKKTGRRD